MKEKQNGSRIMAQISRMNQLKRGWLNSTSLFNYNFCWKALAAVGGGAAFVFLGVSLMNSGVDRTPIVNGRNDIKKLAANFGGSGSSSGWGFNPSSPKGTLHHPDGSFRSPSPSSGGSDEEEEGDLNSTLADLTGKDLRQIENQLLTLTQNSPSVQNLARIRAQREKELNQARVNVVQSREDFELDQEDENRKWLKNFSANRDRQLSANRERITSAPPGTPPGTPTWVPAQQTVSLPALFNEKGGKNPELSDEWHPLFIWLKEKGAREKADREKVTNGTKTVVVQEPAAQVTTPQPEEKIVVQQVSVEEATPLRANQVKDAREVIASGPMELLEKHVDSWEKKLRLANDWIFDKQASQRDYDKNSQRINETGKGNWAYLISIASPERIKAIIEQADEKEYKKVDIHSPESLGLFLKSINGFSTLAIEAVKAGALFPENDPESLFILSWELSDVSEWINRKTAEKREEVLAKFKNKEGRVADVTFYRPALLTGAKDYLEKTLFNKEIDWPQVWDEACQFFSEHIGNYKNYPVSDQLENDFTWKMIEVLSNQGSLTDNFEKEFKPYWLEAQAGNKGELSKNLWTYMRACKLMMRFWQFSTTLKKYSDKFPGKFDFFFEIK